MRRIEMYYEKYDYQFEGTEQILVSYHEVHAQYWCHTLKYMRHIGVIHVPYVGVHTVHMFGAYLYNVIVM